jgi:hypothetical protein
MTIAPTIRTIFSLTRLVVVDTQYIYGMQHFLYWRMQVLLLCGGHQIDVVGDGTKLLLNNRRWELVLNHSRAMHVISLSSHGWHLSRNLRTFLPRLIVLFSSSELDVRAPTAHIQRCGQTPRRYRMYLRYFPLPTMYQPLATGPWRVAPTPPCWASKVSGEMISSYRKPQRRLSLSKWDLDPMQVTGYYTHLGSCHGPAGGAPGGNHFLSS